MEHMRSTRTSKAKTTKEYNLIFQTKATRELARVPLNFKVESVQRIIPVIGFPYSTSARQQRKGKTRYKWKVHKLLVKITMEKLCTS